MRLAGMFWTIPPRFLTGMAAAGGLAFINSIGTMGGFVGPTLMGWLTDEPDHFSPDWRRWRDSCSWRPACPGR